MRGGYHQYHHYQHYHGCLRDDPSCAACRQEGVTPELVVTGKRICDEHSDCVQVTTELKGEAMSTVRDDVYGAIDGERDYQDKRWTANNTPSKGRHETAAFLTYMREYLRRAELLASSFADDGVAPPSHEFMGESALDFVRKITALGVACMEQNGAPRRAEPGCEHVSGPTRCSNCAYES